MSAFFGGKKTKSPHELAEEVAPTPPKFTPHQAVGFETVIGSNTTFLGELRCQNDVRIDGTFEGVLEIEGNILVGETGKINADIHAKNVVVAGAVRGDISGKKVQLLRTARVWGNISAIAITTEEGAFIDGKLTMGQHEAATKSLELPANQPLQLVEGETVSEEAEA